MALLLIFGVMIWIAIAFAIAKLFWSQELTPGLRTAGTLATWIGLAVLPFAHDIYVMTSFSSYCGQNSGFKFNQQFPGGSVRLASSAFRKELLAHPSLTGLSLLGSIRGGKASRQVVVKTTDQSFCKKGLHAEWLAIKFGGNSTFLQAIEASGVCLRRIDSDDLFTHTLSRSKALVQNTPWFVAYPVTGHKLSLTDNDSQQVFAEYNSFSTRPGFMLSLTNYGRSSLSCDAPEYPKPYDFSKFPFGNDETYLVSRLIDGES